jgi:hypothetical protein
MGDDEMTKEEKAVMNELQNHLVLAQLTIQKLSHTIEKCIVLSEPHNVEFTFDYRKEEFSC